MPHVIFENITIECSIRLLLACFCGAIIGIERTRRNKGAGIRTHILVAIGAALFVIVSKYGFCDVISEIGAQVDAARVASNVVTGVSFLGAGLIFIRGDFLQGLTTAAGIWTTAAIGLAIGAGMYLTGIVGAFLVLFIQIILHRSLFRKMEAHTSGQIVVSMEDDVEKFQEFRKLLEENDIHIKECHIKRHKDTSMTYSLNVEIPKGMQPTDVLKIIKHCGYIISVGI